MEFILKRNDFAAVDKTIDFSLFKMENFGLNLPTSIAELQAAAQQSLTNHHHHNHHRKEDPAVSSGVSSFNTNHTELNSSCSSLASIGSNTSMKCSSSINNNQDLNSPCENSLRSWGSNVSLRSNTSSTSSNPATPGSSSIYGDSSKTTDLSKTNCAVCDDKASGKHYGVMTCEGCKSFFKRSIRRNLQYSCRVNSKCSVDKHRRNQCQFCRLNKCMKVGMKKEAVQRGRQTQSPRFMPYTKEPSANVQSSEFSTTLITQLISSEALQASLALNFGNSDLTMDNIGNRGINLLLSIIQWAKANPHFPSLLANDQLSLIKLSWKELFVLHLAESNFPVQVTDLIRNNLEGWSQYGETFLEHVKALQMQLDSLSALQLDPAEYACLKAMLLFTPDAPGLANTVYIQNLQEKILLALETYTKTKYPLQRTRFSKLLLRLASLRTVNPILIGQLFFSWSFGKTPVLDDIVQDMLLASYDDNHSANSYIANNNSHNHHNNMGQCVPSSPDLINTHPYQAFNAHASM